MKILTAVLCFGVLTPLLPAQDLPRANALEEASVRALLGKKSIITGTVTDAFESPKGMTFLNLEGGKFTLVAYKDNYAKFEGGSPAKLYKGKTIEVTGDVFEYRPKGSSKEDPGKLEIKLNSPEQIKVLPTPEAEAPADPKKEAAKPGKDKKEAQTKAEGKDGPSAAKAGPAKTEPAAETPDRVDPKKYFK